MAEIREEKSRRRPKEKKLSRFCVGLIIYSAVLAVIIAALIGVLSAFLYTYETNLPVKTAEKFAKSLNGDALAALIEDTLGDMSELEDGKDVLTRSEYLLGEIRQAKLAKEYTSARPVYRLICGEHDVGKLTLKKAEKDALFGLTRWEVDTAELYKEALPGAGEGAEYTVCVPSGASLTVNGRCVDAKYISEKDAGYIGKSVVTGYDGGCDIYRFDRFYSVPEISATYGGEEISLNASGGFADWFASEEKSFILTLPSDASLGIEGTAPSPSLAVKGELSDKVSEFEGHLADELPSMLSYRVYGDKDTDISVSVNGASLEGKWTDGENSSLLYLYSDESKYRVRAVLPAGAVLYINGVEAGDKYRVGIEEYSSLSGVSYLTSGRLTGDLWEITGLLCEPRISAMLGDTELPLCSLSKNLQTFSAEFYGVPEASLADRAAERADSFTRAYFHYVANGAVGIEENYAALIAFMKPQSPAYKQIQRSKSSFEFVNQSTYTVNKIDDHDFIALGSNLIFCQTDFSVDLRFYQNKKLYEGTISLVFVREGENLLVCDMIIESES
ncbi:MAG: hypothetical protein E7671_02665 [Ruminococcaceae bacterium]|nr:hypothetical protein [Oscillospiraceae bacterium]